MGRKKSGVSKWDRTTNLRFRRALLYPIELWRQMWGRRDLNPQPIGYEPTALTIELHPQKWKEVWESNPCSANIYGTRIISPSVLPVTLTSLKFGSRGGTRTLTPLLATDFKSVVSAIPPLDLV